MTWYLVEVREIYCNCRFNQKISLPSKHLDLNSSCNKKLLLNWFVSKCCEWSPPRGWLYWSRGEKRRPATSPLVRTRIAQPQNHSPYSLLIVYNGVKIMEDIGFSKNNIVHTVKWFCRKLSKAMFGVSLYLLNHLKSY